MSFHVIIPARLQSSRLPGKVLLDIAGRPMLQHVYDRACESGASSVLIATDDDRVAVAAAQWGADVCMTQSTHLTGTDRLAEAVQRRSYVADDIIVGLQADEPLIPPENIQQVAANVQRYPQARVATLSEALRSSEALFDPNVVKVVTDKDGYALYFSRAPIPWDRNTFATKQSPVSFAAYHRHVGLYAYRAAFLKTYVEWAVAPMESLECLEQLRILFQGEKIHVAEAVCPPGVGVDTPQDLARVRACFS